MQRIYYRHILKLIKLYPYMLIWSDITTIADNSLPTYYCSHWHPCSAGSLSGFIFLSSPLKKSWEVYNLQLTISITRMVPLYMTIPIYLWPSSHTCPSFAITHRVPHIYLWLSSHNCPSSTYISMTFSITHRVPHLSMTILILQQSTHITARLSS